MNKKNEDINKANEDYLTKRLTTLLKDEQNSSWVETFYKSRTDRFIAENNKIWTTGRIFIPISIAIFGVYATLEGPTLKQLGILASISIILLVIWEMISITHKRFQTAHEQWLTRIDKVMKVDLPPVSKKGVGLGTLRKALIICVSLVWFCLALNHPDVGVI